MDRITCVQNYVNRLLDTISDPGEHRTAAVHLYGVAGYACLLCLRRGLDPELGTVCGLLHDISTYATGDSRQHAGRSAGMARSCLKGSGMFTQEEISAVCNAVAHHSDKDAQHEPLDEVLKDADVIHHCLHNPSHQPSEKDAARWQRLLDELR
ncbi:MAG: HD domain-containing protein [Clostridia bacterium]|nr:HD domain-containing protein [Clostridia bacterium]